MPTIEIICLEQETPLEFFNLPFALEAENKLIPHRGLFYEEFKLRRGCIYHLENPEMRDDNGGGFFADKLLNWKNSHEFLQFKPEFVPAVQNLLESLLATSPIKKLIFYSDYQFGGRARRYKRPLTLEKFWEKHNAESLRLNALYWLIDDNESRSK
ncbi:MAG: hypothetical protein KY445_11970 [Armatimonadetes bacterium]|nr:hypothetical protein [Armatimonadota bacterium]